MIALRIVYLVEGYKFIQFYEYKKRKGMGPVMSDQEFSDIYERQAERVYAICCFYLGNPADAQDAVQNIFIRLLEKQEVFCSRQHEEAWFYTVARNHCRDILRSGWRKKRIDLGNSLQEKLEHEKIAEDDSNECIEQALRKLPVKQKEVLYLYYYEEYSIKEMSALLHRKESTIQSQLAAGRRKLKKQLVKGGVVDEPKICKSNE